jgi:hypothetical protein
MCVLIDREEFKQPDDGVCLRPGKLEGPFHTPVKAKWFKMIKARVTEEK